LSVLDEHLHAAWQPGGALSTRKKREYRRRTGRPTWRLVRYCDLCRRRHKSHYAEVRVMPTLALVSLVRAVSGFLISA